MKNNQNVSQMYEWLLTSVHTWDGVQSPAVIVVGQKRHCLRLGPLRLSQRTDQQLHTCRPQH